MILKFRTEEEGLQGYDGQECEIIQWINQPDDRHPLESLPVVVVRIGGIMEIEARAANIRAEELPEDDEAQTALLIETLNKIKADEEPCGICRLFENDFPRRTFLFHPLVDTASAVLIGPSGPMPKPYDALTQAGYRVFPLEKDSFGWLVGGINVPGKGVFSFG